MNSINNAILIELINSTLDNLECRDDNGEVIAAFKDAMFEAAVVLAGIQYDSSRSCHWDGENVQPDPGISYSDGERQRIEKLARDLIYRAGIK